MTIARACCARAPTGNDRRQAAASINALKRFMNNPSIEQLDERTSGTGPHHCSRNRLGKVFISSCARKRGDIEFRRCLWRAAVGFYGVWDGRAGGGNEVGGERVAGRGG